MQFSIWASLKLKFTWKLLLLALRWGGRHFHKPNAIKMHENIYIYIFMSVTVKIISDYFHSENKEKFILIILGFFWMWIIIRMLSFHLDKEQRIFSHKSLWVKIMFFWYLLPLLQNLYFSWNILIKCNCVPSGQISWRYDKMHFFKRVKSTYLFLFLFVFI